MGAHKVRVEETRHLRGERVVEAGPACPTVLQNPQGILRRIGGVAESAAAVVRAEVDDAKPGVVEVKNQAPPCTRCQ
eukprot:1221965-Pyramimonas_sp.AAC.1